MTRERAAQLVKEFEVYGSRAIFPHPSETDSIIATLWFTVKELLEQIAKGEGQ